MKKLILFSFIILTASFVQAQDFHLSQFEEAQLYYNPGLTGRLLEKGKDYRVSNIYRSQWSKVATNPYSTIYLGYDTKYDKKWGIGAHIINNQAGANTFRTSNFMVTGSYDIMNDPKEGHILSMGLQLGLMNKSLRAEELIFDSQYSGATGEFDSNLSTGEDIPSMSIYRFDASYGIYYHYLSKDGNYSPSAGISLGHITLPNQSFSGVDERMPIIWRAHFGSDVRINEKFNFKATFLMMFQKKAHEYYLNLSGKYQFENKDYDLRFIAGYRLGDAFIVGAGMRYKDFVGVLSYDINTSYLSNYTNGRGGFEVSIVYQGIFKGEKLKAFMKPVD